MSKNKKQRNMQKRKPVIIGRDEFNDALLSALSELGIHPDSDTLVVTRVRKYEHGGGSYLISEPAIPLEVRWENIVV